VDPVDDRLRAGVTDPRTPVRTGRGGRLRGGWFVVVVDGATSPTASAVGLRTVLGEQLSHGLLRLVASGLVRHTW
jgi:hypothetical protein